MGDARRAPAPVRYRPDVDTHAESKDSGRKPDSKGTRRTLKGPCIVKLRGLQSGSHAMPFQADRTANLGTYMSHAAEQLSHIPLGAGGKMKRVDGNHGAPLDGSASWHASTRIADGSRTRSL